MKNLSTTGYKKNSPDKDRPYNVIPSGEITMKDVDFPVLGIDNLGNSKVMQPGEESISFPGDTVLEFPMLKGGIIRNKNKIYNKIFKK
jgi:hypothetical protein